MGPFESLVQLRTWLREEASIPPRIYVVTEFSSKYRDDDYAKQYGSGKLTGVQGVSDSESIIGGFFGVARDALLIMDGAEFFRANKATKVNYDDPEELCRNNFAALKRLFNAGGRSGPSHLAGNLKRYLGAAAKKLAKNADDFLAAVYRDAEWSALNWMEKRLEDVWEKVRINDTVDYARWLFDTFKTPNERSAWHYEQVKPDFEQLHAAAEESVRLIGAVYKDEAEWVINDPTTLRIPFQSELYVRVADYPNDRYEDWLKKKKGEQVFGFGINYVEDTLLKMVAVEKNKLRKKYKFSYVRDDGGLPWSLGKIKNRSFEPTPEMNAAADYALKNNVVFR